MLFSNAIAEQTCCSLLGHDPPVSISIPLAFSGGQCGNVRFGGGKYLPDIDRLHHNQDYISLSKNRQI